MTTQFTEEPIETLSDWNTILSGGCCCPMPECPAPASECQSASRSLTAMTGSSSEYHIGVPWLDFGNEPGDVPLNERFVAYQFMRVTDTYSEDNVFQVINESKIVTLNKEPPIMERNEAGVPPIIGAVTRVIGTASSNATYYYTEDDGNGGLQQAGMSSQESYSIPINDIATPFKSANAIGALNYTDYDEDGNVTGSGEIEIGVGYGPAWFNFLNPDTVTTSLNGGLLKHEVTGGGRSLTVEFLAPHTPETARDAIVPPPVEPEEWTNEVGLLPSSFSVSFVDEENGDTRLMGASCRRVRFRWAVPDSHQGSFFKITWQILTDPDGQDPDDPDAPIRQLSPDQTWEWTRPGDPEDPDSWKSPWYEIEPPELPGTRRVVNIRFECYRNSPFGARPQVTGEAYDPEEAIAETLANAGRQAPDGVSPPTGRTGRTGGLVTGGLRTGGLSTGGLSTGGLVTGGLRTGGLVTGGLRTGGLRTGGLRTGGLRTGGLRTGGLRTGGLRTGGLRTGGLRTGGLRTSSL